MGRVGFAVLGIFLLSVVTAEKAKFYSYQVHRLVPTNEKQLNALRQLEENPNGLNFWISPSVVNREVDIMVPPHLLPDFEDILTNLELKSEVYINNVQKLIDDDEKTSKQNSGFGWTSYHTLDEINQWLDSLVTQYPEVVKEIIGGQSYQGRSIKGVEVTFKEGNPGVFIESGIHAREWITPATVTYFLNKMLTSTDPTFRELIESFNYYIFPSVNPDGYVYSHTMNRMWRKTRSKHPDDLCYGTDPNRNWDFHWREIGASDNPCTESYAGPTPSSEVEISTLIEFITSVKDKFDVYFSFHSYSQLLLFPYGYTGEAVENHDELLELGNEAIAALEKNNGTRYTVGNIYHGIYPAAGTSLDYIRGVFGTPYVYTWELRDRGTFGFLLPASQIIDTAEETINALEVILQYAKDHPREERD